MVWPVLFTGLKRFCAAAGMVPASAVSNRPSKSLMCMMFLSLRRHDWEAFMTSPP